MTVTQEQDPLTQFMYSRNAAETKRQWPLRLKVLFDLEIEGTLDDQARHFVLQARQDPRWAQDNLIQFISFQNVRVRAREISKATVPNTIKPPNCSVK